MAKDEKRPIIPELSKDSEEFLNGLQQETDRGAALIAGAFLDDVLRWMLEAFFVGCPKEVKDLLGIDRPLGTLSSRTRAAYCLGLIGPDMRNDLDLIRKIRNRFAHHRKLIKFESPEIKARCSELKIYSKIIGDRFVVSPRERFNIGVSLLANQLILRAMAQEHLPEGKDFKIGGGIRVVGKGRGRKSF